MAKQIPNSFKYVLQDESVSKVCREVHVSFKLGKGTYRTFVFVPKKEGQVSKSYYIDEAKKEIDRQIKSGELLKNAKLLDKKHPYLLRGVLITTACVAMVAGSAGLTWYLTQPQPEPQPQPVVQTFKVVQHFGNDAGDESSYLFRGPSVVEEGKTYECSIELKDPFKSTYEISNLHVVMNGVDLKMNEDFQFTPSGTPGLYNLKITKPANGHINILGDIRFNSYNVYCSHVGCSWTSDGTHPAIDTASKNGTYKCFIKANDPTNYDPVIYGITMNNQQLAEDSTGYSFNASTGELIINKKVNGTIHIVSGAVEKVATYVPVYHSEFGCKVTADPIAIIGGSDYTCTVEANNPDTQAPQIVSVAFNGVVVPQSGNYEFTFKSGNAWQLLIHSSVITTELKEIYFSVVAVDKPQEDVDVVFDGGTYCEGIGITTAKLGSTFECRIEPKEAYSTYEVKIVSVVMNGTILDSTKYSYNQATEGNNFSITPAVNGDIHIVASAQEPASTDHAVAIIADTGLKVEGAAETIADQGTYSCTITALDEDNQWGRIPCNNGRNQT